MGFKVGNGPFFYSALELERLVKLLQLLLFLLELLQVELEVLVVEFQSMDPVSWIVDLNRVVEFEIAQSQLIELFVFF